MGVWYFQPLPEGQKDIKHRNAFKGLLTDQRCGSHRPPRYRQPGLGADARSEFFDPLEGSRHQIAARDKDPVTKRGPPVAAIPTVGSPPPPSSLIVLVRLQVHPCSPSETIA